MKQNVHFHPKEARELYREVRTPELDKGVKAVLEVFEGSEVWEVTVFDQEDPPPPEREYLPGESPEEKKKWW